MRQICIITQFYLFILQKLDFNLWNIVHRNGLLVLFYVFNKNPRKIKQAVFALSNECKAEIQPESPQGIDPPPVLLVPFLSLFL